MGERVVSRYAYGFCENGILTRAVVEAEVESLVRSESYGRN